MHPLPTLFRPSALRTAAWLLPLAVALSGPAQAAGTLELAFVQPEQFTDIGHSSFDRAQNLSALQAHFDHLAQRLPDGQRLEVQVLDVDLAGEVQPFAPPELRLMRGGVDWPRMTLRYTLKAGDTTLAQGEDRLADTAYLFTRRGLNEQQALPYERRMLDTWFQQRFVSAGPAR